MAISTIDESQRTAARIAGLAFPISFVTVVAVNFGIFARLIVSGNPAETARKVVRDPSHPTRLLPAYDSGDHLHVNDAGDVAQANAIPLALFQHGR
jgi:hypothetical protein